MAYKTLGKFYTEGVSLPVVADSSIPFNNSIVCNNSCLELSGTTDILVKAPGVYKIDYNANYTGTAVGTVSSRLRANGTDVAGAVGTETIAVIGDIANVSFSTILTVKTGNASGVYATLSIHNLTASSIITANLIITKVA